MESRYQTPATPEQLARMDESMKRNARAFPSAGGACVGDLSTGPALPHRRGGYLPAPDGRPPT
jgi:hypothetical protein